MKRRSVALIAVALIAFGALGDRVLTLSSGQPKAAAATSTSTNHSRVTTMSLPSATTRTTTISAGVIDQATEHAYAVASPSVVYVNSIGTGTGSGIIYDSRGDIVTNNHVVTGASGIEVTLSDGRTFTAHVVGTDPADDLAVIRIQASGLTPATFANTSGYHVAQSVLAIGSPLGLKGSVTFGLISGIDRVEQEPNGANLPNAVQTSAPINPGNSGGALVTLSGVVVGMPTLEQTSAENGTSAQAIGFAIPSTRITDVANQIIATGKVQHTGRAYLGIAPTDPSTQGSPFGFGQGGNGQITSGAVVSQVASGGPAGKAGVQRGDTITQVDGTSISSAQDLLTYLAHKKPGDTITLKIDRNGSTVTVKVRLGELPG